MDLLEFERFIIFLKFLDDNFLFFDVFEYVCEVFRVFIGEIEDDYNKKCVNIDD